jgi:hypothetical protein
MTLVEIPKEEYKNYSGYVNRFDYISKLIIEKDGHVVELNSDEVHALYLHIKPIS